MVVLRNRLEPDEADHHKIQNMVTQGGHKIYI